MDWNPPKNQIVPWFRELSWRLSLTQVPSIAGDHLWISSDYSFDTKDSDFDVVGLLFADLENSPDWHERRQYVRDTFLADGRRLSWKRLGDKRRQDAFFPFLSAADCINGLAVAVAIERDPIFNLATPEVIDEYRGRPWLKAAWKQAKVEQMIQIAYLTAFFVAGLSKPGQSIYWVSDDDAVFANESFHRDTGMTFTKLLNAFSSHSYGTITIGTPTCHGPNLYIEDLNFIPDLLAGATSEFLTVMKREGDSAKDLISTKGAIVWPTVSERGENFMKWFRDLNQPLKRRVCILERSKGHPRASLLHFEEELPELTARYNYLKGEALKQDAKD